MKTCIKCKEPKELELFVKRRDSKDGRKGICKECSNRRFYERYDADYIRNRGLIYKYDITLDQYNVMLEAQNSKCKICNKHESAEHTYLSVDHCHETGVIRGLLCLACNTGIGKLQDNIDTLKSAISYLEEFQ